MHFEKDPPERDWNSGPPASKTSPPTTERKNWIPDTVVRGCINVHWTIKIYIKMLFVFYRLHFNMKRFLISENTGVKLFIVFHNDWCDWNWLLGSLTSMHLYIFFFISEFSFHQNLTFMKSFIHLNILWYRWCGVK